MTLEDLNEAFRALNAPLKGLDGTLNVSNGALSGLNRSFKGFTSRPSLSRRR